VINAWAFLNYWGHVPGLPPKAKAGQNIRQNEEVGLLEMIGEGRSLIRTIKAIAKQERLCLSMGYGC